jgi:hypothetical protein
MPAKYKESRRCGRCGRCGLSRGILLRLLVRRAAKSGRTRASYDLLQDPRHSMQAERRGADTSRQSCFTSPPRSRFVSDRVVRCLGGSVPVIRLSATTPTRPKNTTALQQCRAVLDPPLRMHKSCLAQCPPTGALFHQKTPQ